MLGVKFVRTCSRSIIIEQLDVCIIFQMIVILDIIEKRCLVRSPQDVCFCISIIPCSRNQHYIDSAAEMLNLLGWPSRILSEIQRTHTSLVDLNPRSLCHVQCLDTACCCCCGGGGCCCGCGLLLLLLLVWSFFLCFKTGATPILEIPQLLPLCPQLCHFAWGTQTVPWPCILGSKFIVLMFPKYYR